MLVLKNIIYRGGKQPTPAAKAELAKANIEILYHSIGREANYLYIRANESDLVLFLEQNPSWEIYTKTKQRLKQKMNSREKEVTFAQG